MPPKIPKPVRAKAAKAAAVPTGHSGVRAALGPIQSAAGVQDVTVAAADDASSGQEVKASAGTLPDGEAAKVARETN